MPRNYQIIKTVKDIIHNRTLVDIVKQAMNWHIKIPKEDYLNDPFQIAQEKLLGAYLCSMTDGLLTVGKITELEVYMGSVDKACHAFGNRRTKRTEVMFHQGGCAYMFLVYGLHHQFNVVVSPENEPNAILIRSLEPVVGIDVMKQRRKTDKIENLTTGPGKLCQAMGLSVHTHNGADLTGDQIWICPKDKNYEIDCTPRIGIDYAEEFKDKLWRFFIKNNKFISRF